MLRPLSCLSFFFLLSLCSLSSFGQRIFWTEPTNGRIRVGTLSATSVTGVSNFLNGLNQPQNIALDVFSTRLFYTNNSGEDILVSNSIDGSFISNVVTTGAMAGFGALVYSEDVDGIFAVNAADTDGVTFYPADNNDTGGGSGLDLSGQGGAIYSDVALSINNEVYVVNADVQRIFRTTDLTGDVAVLLPSSPGVKHIAVDNQNSQIYYTVESGTTSIWRANLDGTANTQIFSGIAQEVTSIKVYPQFDKLYYVRSGVGIHGMNLNGTGDALVTGIGTAIEDFAIADVTDPGYMTLSPADGSIDVPLFSDLGMTFTENIKIATTPGTPDEESIRIYKKIDGSLIQTINRSSSNISIVNKVVTISGITSFVGSTEYYVLIGGKVFTDLSGNGYIGIPFVIVWNFTTLEDQTKFYSRIPNGNYDDATTWTHSPTHSGPAATSDPGTGSDIFIGNGHIVTLTNNTGVVANTVGITIEPGGTLDANNFELDLFNSDLIIHGTLLRGGILSGIFNLNSTTGPPIFSEINCGATGFSGAECNLATDVIALNGLNPIDGGILNANGHDICNAAINPPPINTGFTNKKSTSVTLNWSTGATDAFIIARQGSTDFQPSFELPYNSNTVFGSGDAVGAGNFVVYKGTANSANITGLLPNTDYEFDFYSYSTLVGGCYSIRNYHSAQTLTTCSGLPAPLNPVNASYCTGDVKPAINVNSPGSGRNINWFDAAVFGNPVTGNVSGGDGRGGVFIPTATSGTFYAEIYDGTTQCTSDVRTEVTLTLNPIVVPGTATGIQTVCVGDDPTLISGGTATGGDGNYTYQWESATASTTGPYTDIQGAALVNYDPPAGILLTTHYRRRVTSSTCTSQLGNFISVTIGSPTNVTALTNTPGDAQITLNWTNPLSCFDEVLILGKQDGTPVFTPVGNGTAYTASPVFGSGTALISNEFVVYKGSGTSVIVTGLTNSISYTFKVFTRKGIVWSPGAITSGTGIPTPPVIAFVPTNGATNILVAANLTISFNEPVRNLDNSAIDNSNVGSLLTLKLTNAAGANVPFTASINGTKDVVTLDPTTALLPSQLYYLNISPVEDSNNNASTASSITFTTQAGPFITNVAPLSACVGQSVTITGNNFGTSTPTVTINGVNATVTAHSNTAITIVSTAATTGPITILNNDMALSTVSIAVATISAYPTLFNVTGGGSYCVGAQGLLIGLANSQSGVEYEIYQGGLATGIKVTSSGGAFNFPQTLTVANTYAVTGTNNGLCKIDMTGSAVVVVRSLPSGMGSVVSTPTQICQNETASVTVTGILNANSYTWSLPPGVIASPESTTSTITVKGLSPAGGLISVVAQNECGISSSISTTLVVNPLPIVSISTPPSNKQIIDDVLEFSSSVDIDVVSYNWNFGDGGSSSDENPTHVYTNEGSFPVSLLVKTAVGCEGSAEANVAVTTFPILSTNAIKNMVTANEDGKNDRLIVVDIERFPNNTITVLDRWGIEVHKQNAYNNEWDFKKGGNYLPAGNYICIVKLNDSGAVITRTVTLVKK